MLVLAVPEETYCLKSQAHSKACNGTNHVCYRCGFLLGPCNCSSLGSLLDY